MSAAMAVKLVGILSLFAVGLFASFDLLALAKDDTVKAVSLQSWILLT